MAEKEKKELTVDAKELAKDPAVNIVEEVPVTIFEKPDEFTPEELESGIASGKTSAIESDGSTIGIRFDEEDSIQKKSE